MLSATLRKEGETLKEIAETVKHPLTTVGDWLRRMQEEGIGRRCNIRQTGRPKHLTPVQIATLKGILSKPPKEQGLPFVMWTTKLVRHYIEKKYKVAYKLRQTRNILYGLGMSSQKPRPSHRKANKNLQEAFKKTSGKQLDPMLKMDMRSSCWMKAYSR